MYLSLGGVPFSIKMLPGTSVPYVPMSINTVVVARSVTASARPSQVISILKKSLPALVLSTILPLVILPSTASLTTVLMLTVLFAEVGSITDVLFTSAVLVIVPSAVGVTTIRTVSL